MITDIISEVKNVEKLKLELLKRHSISTKENREIMSSYDWLMGEPNLLDPKNIERLEVLFDYIDEFDIPTEDKKTYKSRSFQYASVRVVYFPILDTLKKVDREEGELKACELLFSLIKVSSDIIKNHKSSPAGMADAVRFISAHAALNPQEKDNWDVFFDFIELSANKGLLETDNFCAFLQWDKVVRNDLVEAKFEKKSLSNLHYLCLKYMCKNAFGTLQDNQDELSKLSGSLQEFSRDFEGEDEKDLIFEYSDEISCLVNVMGAHAFGLMSTEITKSASDFKFLLKWVRETGLAEVSVSSVKNCFDALPKKGDQGKDALIEGIPLLFLKEMLKPFTKRFDEKNLKEIDKSTESFYATFKKVNDREDNYHKVKMIAFFSAYDENMGNLVYIMGAPAIKFMQSKIAYTGLSLHRLLSGLHERLAGPLESNQGELKKPLKTYFDNNDLTKKKEAIFIQCINAIGVYFQLLEDRDSYIFSLDCDSSEEEVSNFSNDSYADPEDECGSPSDSDIISLDCDYSEKEVSNFSDDSYADPEEAVLNLDKKMSPEEILNEYSNEIYKLIFGTQLDDEACDLFGRIPAEEFFVLIKALSHMTPNDEYRGVFLELLKRDLFGAGVDEFLHDISQSNDVGRKLARHNQAIRDVLKKKKINVQMALGYKKRLKLKVDPNVKQEASELDSILLTMGTYIQKLFIVSEKEIKGSLEEQTKTIKLLNSILRRLASLQSSGETKKLDEKNAQKTLEKINTSLIKLQKFSTQLSSSFNEFAGHFTEQYVIMKSYHKKNKTTKQDVLSFTIEQWSKNKSKTFLLGNDVGCCLATNNDRFPAMVQRRMDDAMLFHVAIDDATQKPAALIWLYLAKTTDDKVVLVANFIEFSAKYDSSDLVKKSLLEGLLRFTAQYCKDNPNINAFYMNELSYGRYPTSWDSYVSVQHNLVDKVGGPLIMDSESEVEYFSGDEDEKLRTLDKYYLVSLKAGALLHQFCLKTLKKSSVEKKGVVEFTPETERSPMRDLGSSSGFFSNESSRESRSNASFGFGLNNSSLYG